MCWSARAKAIMLRHDMLPAWRRLAHRAGVSTAGEPAMDRLRNAAPTSHEDPGDILAVLPGSLVAANVFVVHPAPTSYSRAEASTCAWISECSRDTRSGAHNTLVLHGDCSVSVSSSYYIHRHRASIWSY
jgi:hypothetical protein